MRALPLLLAVLLAACSEKPEKQKQPDPKEAGKFDVELEYKKGPHGLEYADILVGKGPFPRRGSKCVVHYIGWLDDGSEFLAEEGRKRLGAERVQVDGEPCPTGKSHFARRHQQAAVGAVMIGEEQA